MGPPNHDLTLLIIIFIAIFGKVDSQCTSETIPTSLETLSQYQIGNEGDSYYSHLLANGESSFTFGNATAAPAYQLSAFAIPTATDDCPAACVTSVSAYYQASGSNVTILMLRPSDETLYPDYTSMGLPAFMCATVSGYCGAQNPLYQYYSSSLDDYISDLQQPNNTNATYTVSMMGLPLCYLWTPNVTTTTTTTTTTTVDPLIETNETEVSNTTSTTTSTTTTITPILDSNDTSTTNSSTTTTTLSPDDAANTTTTTTITTSSSEGQNGTTTTISPNNTVDPGSSNSTSTSEPDKKKHGFWHNWKWPIIVVGCLLAIGIVTAIVGCLTCCFIGAGSPSKIAPNSASPPPSYDSPSPPELPPQPVYPTSMQPFTVGLPPTVPY